MLHFNGSFIGERIIWELIRYDDDYIDDGLTISFHVPIQLKDREALNYLKQHLPEAERKWLHSTSNQWAIDLSLFKAKFHDGIVSMLKEEAQTAENQLNVTYLGFRLPTNLTLELLEGFIAVEPEVAERDMRKETRTTVNFIITYDNLKNNQPQRIFLSHKSADKPLVRAYKEMLRTLGFEPWMDEDDLKAGDKLHRGILQGFNDSYAAVFFITKNYLDESYLATEIDYAMDQHYKKKDRFKIITLVIMQSGEAIKVPELLQQFVYKNPKSQFEGLTEILKALPIGIDGISFKK